MFLHGNYLDDSESHSCGQLVIGSFITTTCQLIHHISCRVFWKNIKSPRWLSSPTAQIWCPVTSGFSQNSNHLWKGRDFRLLIRFRKIRWGSWWRLGEVCKVPRCLLWREVRCHCPAYNVSCILYLLQWMSLFFILRGWILSGQTFTFKYKHTLLFWRVSFLYYYFFSHFFFDFPITLFQMAREGTCSDSLSPRLTSPFLPALSLLCETALATVAHLFLPPVVCVIHILKSLHPGCQPFVSKILQGKFLENGGNI